MRNRAKKQVAGACSLAALNATKLAESFAVTDALGPKQEQAVSVTSFDQNGKKFVTKVLFDQVKDLPTDRSGSAWYAPFEFVSIAFPANPG